MVVWRKCEHFQSYHRASMQQLKPWHIVFFCVFSFVSGCLTSMTALFRRCIVVSYWFPVFLWYLILLPSPIINFSTMIPYPTLEPHHLIILAMNVSSRRHIVQYIDMPATLQWWPKVHESSSCQLRFYTARDILRSFSETRWFRTRKFTSRVASLKKWCAGRGHITARAVNILYS